MGIYTAAAVTGYPGSLVVQAAGSFNAQTVAIHTLACNATLEAGRYWMAYVNTVQATVRAWSVIASGAPRPVYLYAIDPVTLAFGAMFQNAFSTAPNLPALAAPTGGTVLGLTGGTVPRLLVRRSV